MKWKKLLVAAMAVFSLSMPVASAEIVTVNGSGVSETAAINEAKRAAVENVVGTTIKAKSLMVDMQLVMDAIDSRTQGYVTSCEVISKKTEGGLVTVTAKVDVSAEPNSSLMKDLDVVMMLQDPRLAVIVEHYGDDGGETFKRYATMCVSAIREELAKRGFTHIIDTDNPNPTNVDYIIYGNLTVDKGKQISIPDFSDLSKSTTMGQIDTGLTRLEAIMDCKIKKSDTAELIGEFHANGDGFAPNNGSLDNKAVEKLAVNAAQEVRLLFNRQAQKVFTSVKVFAQSINAEKIFQLEDILRQTHGVNSVYMRSFLGGICTIDVGTDLAPRDLYIMLTRITGDEFKINLQGLTSTVLQLSIE